MSIYKNALNITIFSNITSLQKVLKWASIFGFAHVSTRSSVMVEAGPFFLSVDCTPSLINLSTILWNWILWGRCLEPDIWYCFLKLRLTFVMLRHAPNSITIQISCSFENGPAGGFFHTGAILACTILKWTQLVTYLAHFLGRYSLIYDRFW